MNVKDLPSGGSKFRATVGSGNFSQKLSSATRLGGLQNLRDNKDVILKTVKKNERAIKLGSFNRMRQNKAMSDIKKISGSNLTKGDIRDIKKILEHLGTNKTKADAEPVIEKKLAKDNGFIEDRNAEMKRRISRLDQTTGGDETSLKINNDPYNPGNNEKSTTAKLLEKRYQTKDDRVARRLPKERVDFEQERTKRVEASSLGRDMNAKRDDNKSDTGGYQPFQNL